jgi:hypothetical protein
VKYKSGYGVIVKKSKNQILSKIKNIEWNKYSSLATNSVKHIRRHAIEKCLFELGFGLEIDEENTGATLDNFFGINKHEN